MNLKRFILIFSLVLVSAFVIARHAGAQYAPEGNAHPAGGVLAEIDAANPFGDPAADDPMTPADKHAFSREIDLGPLRDAAVYHNGRVKILDTLARETVRAITGRGDYLDYIPTYDDAGAVVAVRKLRYDPLFTFIDLLASPTYSFDKPLIHVSYLPARQALIDAAIADADLRERWMRLTRLSPELVATSFRPVAENFGTDAEIARALGDIRAVGDLLRLGHTNLLMVAPEPGAERWRHVSELPAGSPVRVAFAEIGRAWRAGDAAAVNSNIITLADALRELNAGSVSPARLRLEAIYNSASPFEIGAWMYVLAFVSLVIAFGTGWRAALTVGVVTLLVALGAHTFGFGARWFIAERLPIQNQFESMTGLALGGALAGLLMTLFKRQWLFGAAGAAVGFLILLAATQTGVPGATIGREAAILNTSWLLKYHVSTVLISYGLITLAAVMSAFYLALHYARDRGAASAEIAGFTSAGLNIDDERVAGRRRLLADLDRAQMSVLQLAFWILGVGILLGAWWADHSWGRWWAFDPKETWALLTWIVYLIVIHVRLGVAGDRGLVTAWLSIVGFVVMLWTYFGVNLLLPGLHAYA